ncbi:hypothetical protein M011DRAFT_528555 [Sporormia fimetaria CBS 119925]|uniref:Uncharacterized protein n=1 Tax=Sporormia fimetaria CBS 119925 TaxID=1340428 RepID=A0A6A6V143_9PLEO|nr:hypothetical protein M011DRAFT_528555 [Sporormia fimetaria CBS 119925]
MPRNSRNPYDRAPQIRRPIGPNDRARLVFPFPGGAGSGFPFPPPWPDGSQRPNSGAGSGFPFPPPGAQRSQNPSGFSQNPSSSQSGSETSDPGDPSENQAGLPPSSLHSWDVFSLPCQRTLFRRMHDLRNEMASRPGGGSLAGRLHGRLQGSPLGIIAEQLGVPLWERLGRGAILAGSSPRARAMMRNPRLAMCLAKWGERRGLGRLNVREYMVSGRKPG